MKVKQGMSVIWLFLKIPISITLSMKSSRWDLFIDMVVDMLSSNNRITLSPCFTFIPIPKTLRLPNARVSFRCRIELKILNLLCLKRKPNLISFFWGVKLWIWTCWNVKQKLVTLYISNANWSTIYYFSCISPVIFSATEKFDHISRRVIRSALLWKAQCELLAR